VGPLPYFVAGFFFSVRFKIEFRVEINSHKTVRILLLWDHINKVGPKLILGVRLERASATAQGTALRTRTKSFSSKPGTGESLSLYKIQNGLNKLR
jgi:hypothetical protein